MASQWEGEKRGGVVEVGAVSGACFEGTYPQKLTFHLAVFRCAVVLDYMG